MDSNYLSIGIILWNQLGRVITEKRFLQKWSNKQTFTQSVVSFSFAWALLAHWQMKLEEAPQNSPTRADDSKPKYRDPMTISRGFYEPRAKEVTVDLMEFLSSVLPEKRISVSLLVWIFM
jgi:hypothetical protein